MIPLLLAAAARYMLIVMLGMLIVLIGYSTWVDIKRLRRRQSAEKSYKKLRRTTKFKISVIIWAHNDERTILQCLSALRANRYKHCHVVIVELNSNDATKRTVQHYMGTHPNFKCSIYTPRKSTSRDRVLQEAYKRSGRGDVIAEIVGSSIVPARFLSTIATWFVAGANLNAVYFYDRDISSRLLAHYFHIVDAAKNQLRKNTVWQAGTVAYSKGSLKDKNQRQNFVYESSLRIQQVKQDRRVAYTVHPKSTFLHSALLIGAVAVWLLMSYSMILAGLLISTQLLFWCWLIIIILGISFLLNDETMQWSERLETGVILPGLFFIFYAHFTVLLLTLIVNIFRQLARFVGHAQPRLSSLPA